MATTNKTLNTRVQLKYDLYANWTSANPVLLKGEIAIVEIPAASNAVANEPAILFKVGDGNKNFNSLNWASATAADVHAWAKEATLTINKEGTGNVVSEVVWDASANGGKGGIKYKTASVATSEGLAALQAIVDTINKDYLKDADKTELQNAIDAKLASADFETFKTENTAAIADAKKAGTDAAAALDTYKTSNDAIVNKLNGDDTVEGSVAKALKDAKAYTDEKDTAMDSRVADLEAMFGDGEGTVEAQIEAAIATEVAARDAAIKVEADRAVAVEAAIKTSIGTVPEGKDVVTMISDAQTAAEKKATDLNAALEPRVKTNEDALAILNGSEIQEGSVKKITADAVASIVADAPEAYDTLKEISDWIAKHPEDSTAMNTEIQRLAAILAGIGNVEAGEKATVVAYVTAEIDAIKALLGTDEGAGDTSLIARVSVLESALAILNGEATVEGSLQKVLSDAKAYADGLAGNYDAAGSAEQAKKDAIADAEAKNATLKAELEAYADQAEADAIADAEAKNATLKTELQGYADQAETDAIASAKAYTDEREDAIALEIAKKVTAEDGKRLMTDAEGTKLAAIEEGAQVNKIEVIKVNGVEQAIVDKTVDISHNVDDLEQDADTYVTLFCGSATEVI